MESVVLYGGLTVLLTLYVINLRGASKLKEELEFIKDSIDGVRRHVNVSSEDMKQQMGSMIKKEFRKLNGDAIFHKDMTVAEALRLHTNAEVVMSNFHLGGCSSCSITEQHVLGPAAEGYGVDIDALLEALNGLLDGSETPEAQNHPQKDSELHDISLK